MVQGVPQRATFGSQMFTFRGRSNRANYWLSVLALSLAYTAVLATTLAIFSQSDALLDVHPAGVWVALLNWGIFVVLYSFAVIRRLHDRGKSGHWVWLFCIAAAMLNIVDRTLESQTDVGAPHLILIIPTLALAIWGIVELGFLRGTVGPNRFGPDV
jgi:uncharacterized membrane protein YhaH (DUF805 family)